MPDKWFISDTHFEHVNIIKHTGRPFGSVDEMNEEMIQRWNAVVKDGDIVYHLGDVAWIERAFKTHVSRLRGRKRLCLGNHDEGRSTMVREHFSKISLWEIFDEHRFLCSHIPLMPSQFRRGAVLNVHGHIHENPDPSPQHMNICVEKTGYAPIHFDTILAEIEKRGLKDAPPAAP